MIARTRSRLLPAALIAIGGVAVFLLSPQLAILALIVTLASGLAAARPDALVAIYAAMILSNAAAVATDDHGLPPTGLLVALFLAAALLLRALWGREDVGPAIRLALPAAAYLAILALALLWVSDLAATRAALSETAKGLLGGLIFVGFLTSMPRISVVVVVSAATIGCLAVLALAQYFLGDFDHNYLGFATASIQQIAGETSSWRIAGPVRDPNYFGQLLVLGLPLVGALAVTARSRPLQAIAVLGALAILLAIYLTFSRGALLGTAVVFTAAAAMSRHRWLYLGLVVALAAIGLALGPSGFIQRLLPIGQAVASLFDGEQWGVDSALNQRLAVARVAVEMFTAHPWLGIGIGQFPVQFADYALHSGLDLGAPAEAHSRYLETLAEGGIVGLTMLFGIIAAAFAVASQARWRLWKDGRSRGATLLRGLQISFLGYLATAIFLHGAYDRFFWLLVALLLSSGSIARRRVGAAGRIAPSSWSKSLSDELSSIPDARGALWRHRYLIVVATLLGLAGGWVQVRIVQPRYAAETTLLYRFGREYFPVTPGEVRRNWGENVPVSLDAALFSEMHLLNSTAMFERTLASVDDQPATGVSAPPPEPARVHAQHVEALARAFDIRRVQGAAMVSISVQDPDPARADYLLQTHIETYRGERSRIFDADALGFFDAQIAAAVAEHAALMQQRAQSLTDAPRSGAEGARVGTTGEASASRTLELQLAPLDAQIGAVAENLALLRQERANAALSQQYRDSVAPTFVAVDWRGAEGNSVGLAPATRMAMAALFGLALSVILVLVMAALRGTLTTPPAPRRRRSGLILPPPLPATSQRAINARDLGAMLPADQSDRANARASPVLKLGFVVTEFPKTTETFILRDVMDLHRMGCDIRLFHLTRFNADEVLHDFAAPTLEWARSYPFIASFEVLGALGFYALRRPLALASILRDIVRGSWRDPIMLLKSVAILPKSLAFARAMQAWGATHVHAAYAGHPATTGWIVQRVTGIPFSCSSHAHDLFETQALLARKLPEATFVRTISAYNRDFILSHVPALAARPPVVIHVGNYLPRQRPHAPSLDPDAADDTFRILFVGSLERRKGLDLLLRAVSCLGLADWTLDVLGDGPEAARLQRLSARLGIDGQVTFHGRVGNDVVQSAMTRASVLVVPSRIGPRNQTEGLPTVIVEAFSSCLPVIATRLTGIPEIVRDQDTGLLVEMEDLEGLTSALETVYSDPAAVARWVRNGWNLVAREFNQTENSRRLFDLIVQDTAASTPQPTSDQDNTVVSIGHKRTG